MKRYVGSYSIGGQRRTVTVEAYSWADAEMRVRFVEPFSDARIDGEFLDEFPVNDLTLAPVGMMGRLWCWVRNLGRQGMARGKVWRNTMRAQRQKDVADSQRALDELVARGLAVKGPDDRYRTPEAHEAVFGKPN